MQGESASPEEITELRGGPGLDRPLHSQCAWFLKSSPSQPRDVVADELETARRLFNFQSCDRS